MTGSRRVGIDAGEREVDVFGRGEPVLVVQTALDADELLPLAEQIARAGPYRVIHHHRRGYAGSSPLSGDPSIPGDAADARALVQALAEEPVHVVGASYSAAVALSLASQAPESVRTVTVIELPPFRGRSATEFRAANARLHDLFRASGPRRRAGGLHDDAQGSGLAPDPRTGASRLRRRHGAGRDHLLRARRAGADRLVAT